MVNSVLSKKKLLMFCLSFTVFISSFTHGAINGATKRNTLIESRLSQSTHPPSKSHLNIRLYAQNENLILRFENGNSVLFKPNNDQFAHRIIKNKIHTHEQLGRIETHNTKRIWHSTQNVNVEFLGSYPVAATIGTQHVSLNYQDKEWVRASTSNVTGQNLAENPTQVIEHVQTALSMAEQSACSNEKTDDQCTNPDAPLPVGFGTPQDSNELHINSRPSDCHSFFTAYPSIERGTAIEAALANHAPYVHGESGSHSFPVADYWSDGDVFVLISRDLTANSYQPLLNPDGFYEQIMADGENIQEKLIQPLATDGQITQSLFGEESTLTAEEAQTIYFDVIVQFGVMSEAQKEQFDRASDELSRLYGIVLRLISIP